MRRHFRRSQSLRRYRRSGIFPVRPVSTRRAVICRVSRCGSTNSNPCSWARQCAKTTHFFPSTLPTSTPRCTRTTVYPVARSIFSGRSFSALPAITNTCASSTMVLNLCGLRCSSNSTQTSPTFSRCAAQSASARANAWPITSTETQPYSPTRDSTAFFAARASSSLRVRRRSPRAKLYFAFHWSPSRKPPSTPRLPANAMPARMASFPFRRRSER